MYAAIAGVVSHELVGHACVDRDLAHVRVHLCELEERFGLGAASATMSASFVKLTSRM
jgi:hypothetical protein